MKTVPFWTDNYPRPADLAVSRLPEAVDVAIVGGGYTGLNAARVLAKGGAATAVLERNTIGWGASSRNGGMATTGIKQKIGNIFNMYGKELGRAFWQSSLDAIDLIGEIVADEELDCDFGRKGHIALAYKPSHYESMAKKADWYRRELGHRMEMVPKSDIHSEIGSDAFYGGMVDEYSAGLHPAKYVFELARVAAKYGACLCENCGVTQIEKTGNGFNVHTTQGIIKAKEVLVATNGYTDRLIPQLKPRIFPVGSYIIVTEPLSVEMQKQLSPKGRMFYDTKNFLNYFRLTPDGRMLFGGRNNLSVGLDLHESATSLKQQMHRVFPQLDEAPITHTWTGQLGLTFDLMPHIGRINGVMYAMGYGGHGVSIATYVGTEAGLLLAGKKSDSPFAQIKHQTMFFYRNKPWFLPFAAMYYRTLDKLT
jgi:glycine/D-amino acid oxidase-like deaminating enzyme